MNRKQAKMSRIILVAVTLVTLAFANFAVASTSSGTGTYRSMVFAKVNTGLKELEIEGSWEVLLSISLPDVPISAYYHVVCDGYSYINSSDGIRVAISVDGNTYDERTFRAYWTFTTEDGGTNIHTELLYYLDPGSHTFDFLGDRMGLGPGLCRVNFHSITVTVYSDGSLELGPPPTTEVNMSHDKGI